MSRTTTETIDSLDVPDGTSSGQSSASVSPQVLRLKLKKEEKKCDDQKKVKFSSETVDNEGLDRKKSKCCCIYRKPHNFDQSSDSEDSDLESDHCFGHKCQHKTDSHSMQT